MRWSCWPIVALITVLGTWACSRTTQPAPEALPPASRQPTGIQDWSLESSAPGPPMAMGQLMARADQLLENRSRSSRAGWIRGGGLPDETRCAAPYLYVPGADDGSETLPLESTSARVNIAGVIAQVVVTQVYRNRGTRPIEAVYAFPASTRAAVHGMRMTIGKRVITAKIEERGKARVEYETAKDQGKRASLLEQERPNVFMMNVANIMPGDVIKTELLYSELLVPEDGLYSFVYPTVVGPRNAMRSDPASHGWVANPHLSSGQKEPYGFDIHLQLQSPIPLKGVGSPSHPVKVTYASPKTASISFAEPGSGNRDFVLRYRLRGDRIETGTMVYDGGGEKFFLMMMEPPERVEKTEIMPREYVFVLDVSGSMAGFPIETAKRLMQDLLSGLSSTEYFNVVLFAGGAGALSPQSLPATSANVQTALAYLQQLRGGGGTDLMEGLQTAYALPRPAGDSMSRSVVVVTDGYVTVEAQAFRFIRNNLGEANLFSFGIGSSVNRALIEGMARAGMGSPFVVLDPSDALEKAAELRKTIDSPLLTDIRVSFQGLDVYDVIPTAQPDLMAARPLIVFGKYRGGGQGTIDVVGTQASGILQQRMVLDATSVSAANRPLRALWARSWADDLMDQHAVLGGDPEIERGVTHLGLRYGLLTQFTSFVAVDTHVANTTGKLVTVRQPLPLPQGVPNSALPTATGHRMKIVETESDIVLLEPVRFAQKRDTIDPASYPLLDEIVALMKARPDLRIGVYGHTDDRGSDSENLLISERRAAACVRYLVKHGIDPSRLESKGFGAGQPIASNDTEEGRARNRRVEFKILAGGG